MSKIAYTKGIYTHVPIKYLGIPSDGKGNLLDWTSQSLWSNLKMNV
ncbi:MAG: hypothetical protein H6567_00065 [Lewinellaceae bacterium]|jgi:hypothetical protein|nr:hypothetical protein [Lewinellaceae bacterium]